MKWMLGVAAIFVVFGAWAGSRAEGAASLVAKFQTGLAIFIAGQLLFCLWVWYRAKPGSGDRMVLPSVMLGSAAMLVMILPQLFWPGAERIHIAASIVGVAVPAVLLITQIRRRRRLRRNT